MVDISSIVLDISQVTDHVDHFAGRRIDDDALVFTTA
jgi:hypothetical protein